MKDVLGLNIGGVWRTAPVGEQPSLTLARWQVMQLPHGERHLVGYALQNREGRVSSAVATLDAASLRGVTATGRVYALSGRPGHDSDAEYTWRAWARINAAHEWTDVTAEVWAAHLEACKRPDEGEGELR
ncbi:MAG: hypothetical protein H0W40_11525 [Methylibium sp.]|uniref:hypothetical protein n=1 Tax=Methylibium sp. TaxID=2067992 RepID=UPI0017B6B235|nr:hypothetical protein [Methylibium sp.]MBA3597987.1 hypothetical protein [Methylibium sp.]